MDIVAFDYHVAQIDADPEIDPLIARLGGVAFRHAFLDLYGALDGINNARELHQQSVAGGLGDTVSSARDSRLDQFVEMGVESRARPSLLVAH